MDSKTNHNSTKTDESVPVGVQTSDIKDDTSRFSRRRFLRSAAVASPILLSVKSPTAWGGTGGLYAEQCSITLYLSGNPSNPSELGCEARDIEYWKKVFNGGNKVVENELAKRGVTASTQFFQLFPLAAFQSWRMSDIVVDGDESWYYKINEYSDNPTLLQALEGTGLNLSLDFAKGTDIVRDKNNTVDLTDSVPDFHAVMVSAYLNSMFHPTPVSYLGDEQYVSDIFAVTLKDSIDACLSGIVSTGSAARMMFRFGSVSYSEPMKNLRDALNTWDWAEA